MYFDDSWQQKVINCKSFLWAEKGQADFLTPSFFNSLLFFVAILDDDLNEVGLCKFNGIVGHQCTKR